MPDLRTILLVDDNKTYHQIFSAAFDQSKFHVVICTSGQAALNYIEQYYVDVICASYVLPDTDGIKLCQQVKALTRNSYKPFILISSSNIERLIQAAIPAGVTDVFAKDNLENLLAFISRISFNIRKLNGRVLYVEDDPAQRAHGVEIMLTKGLSVDAFSDAEKAWDQFLARDYDLVITDIVLAGKVTGLMLINRIKRLINKKGDVPILAVTAFDDRTRRLELFHFGVDDYLIKPLIDEDLLFRIQSLITRKQLKQQDEHNQLARLIYQHSSEGMMVTDENNQIIAVNPAFTDITGFTEAEVFGKTPSVLSSQAHDNEFFKNLWHDLHLKGEWSGEIWNKRKNGQKFLAWMNINTLKDKNNLIYRYIAIFTDITSRIKADAIVLQEANFDSLTALPNRRLLKQYVEQAIKQAKREHQNFALLFIDLDDFKPLNDNYSHNFGDNVLTAFSKRIRDLLRDSDIVARYGGDEFVVVIYQFESIENLNNIVHKLQQGLAKIFLIDEIEINLSVSIGISLYPNNGQHFDQLIKQADQAMYQAKKLGKKQCCYYESTN